MNMKRNVGILVFWGIITSLFAQDALEGGFAPVNPQFLNYIKTKNSSKTGIIPSVYTISFDSLPKMRSALILPTRFDLRETGILLPPRDQGTANTCWTFATMDAIQSVWAKMGFQKTSYSEENLANCHGFDVLKDDGGNSDMAMAYLSRFSGPVYETSDPYVNNPLGTCNTLISKSDKEALISEAIYLPKDVQTIKQMVYRYGGVVTAMSWWQLKVPTYYNPATFSVFMKSPYAGNVVDHAVTIVGWDDSFVVSNSSGDNPSGPGAWIIKNTTGTAKYDGGYFYASYEDCHIGSYATVYPQRIEKSRVDTVFYYDKLGHVDDYGSGVVDSAIVLIKYTAPQKKLVTAIGTFTSVAASKLDIEVYQTKTGQVLSGLLAQKKGLLCEYPGYHTFDMPFSVTGNFYVKIKYKAPGSNYPIPVERSVAGYSTVNVKPVGYQWLKYYETDTLRTVGITSRQFNLCVKVYAQNPPKQPLFNTVKNRYCIADTVVYKNTSVGSYDSFTWNFGADASPLTATTISVNDSVKVVYSTNGLKKVSLKAITGAVTDSIVKGNAVEILSGVPLDIQAESVCGEPLINKTVYLKPTGGDSYHWLATPFSHDTTTTSTLSFIIGESTQKFKVTATLGHCVASDSITITPTDGVALYDDIANAKLLTIGAKEGPFSNACATWRQNEPHPAEALTCTSQSGWCPGVAVLDNSLWFKFTAPIADSVKIVTSGFDNQIALYDALSTGTYADIISGNPSNYAILAANDDSSDVQYAATIQPIKLTAGKTYWLQMDGSCGGVTGNAYITVTGINATAITDTKDKPPYNLNNPVKDGIIIINNAQTITQVELIDLTGKTLSRIENKGNANINMDVFSLHSGYYLLKIQTEKGIDTHKVLIEK